MNLKLPRLRLALPAAITRLLPSASSGSGSNRELPGRARTGPGVDGPVGRRAVVSRLSLVFLVVGIPAAGVLYDRVDPARPQAVGPVDGAIVTPSVSDPAPLDAAWYCPMGSAAPDGMADHRVYVSNLGQDTAVVNLMTITADGPGPGYRQELAPLSTREFVLSSILTAPVAGAVVEIIGGTGVVGHSVTTASGEAEGPCSTHVSNSWFFASGRTTRDADQYLALMNPFPEDVRFNVEFYRSAGRPRKPAALTGQEVPANSIRIVNVGDYVAREEAVAAAITTDRGRLVVERLQVLDGVLGPSGASLQLGVVAPAESWMLPAGRLHESGDDQVVVFNPSPDATATVEVELWPDNPTDRSLYGLGAVTRELQPGRFEIINLRSEADRYGISRLPYELGVSVASTNGVPVVVERWHLARQVDTSLIGAGGDEVAPTGEPSPADPSTETTAPADGSTETTVPADGAAAEGELDLPGIFGEEAEPLLQPTANVGIATSRGTEVLSTRWVVPWVSTPGENATVVVVSSPKEAQVEVMALVNGVMEGPFRATVPLGGRAVIPVNVGVSGVPLLVTANAPISVEAQVVVVDGRLATVPGIPTVSS